MPRRTLVSRVELSRRARVSKEAVSKACNHGSLRPACVRQRVDIDHPAVVAYLRRHEGKFPVSAQVRPKPEKAPAAGAGGQPKAQKSGRKPQAGAPGVSPKSGGPEGDDEQDPRLPFGVRGVDADVFGRMTLEQIAREYSSMTEFSDVLDAAKTLAIIREKDDRHAQFEGSVVPRELVTAGIFGLLDRLFRRLLGPVPKTIIRRAAAELKAGATAQDAEKIAADLIGSELKAIRDQIARTLREV